MSEIEFDLFAFSFADYLALSQAARDQLIWRAYQSLDGWIEMELAQRRAAWILVCGGNVVDSSPTLRNYPEDETLMSWGTQTGLIPFVFVKGLAIEE